MFGDEERSGDGGKREFAVYNREPMLSSTIAGLAQVCSSSAVPYGKLHYREFRGQSG